MTTLMTDLNWQKIPLSSVPAQTLHVTLGSQSFRMEIQQRASGLYLSLFRSGARTIVNRLCRDRTWIIRHAYYGMPGDLIFIDMQGRSDPDYMGLVSRHVFLFRKGTLSE